MRRGQIAGRAYVFDTATGNLIATLNNPSPDVNDPFGASVAVSGATAIVGAYRDESDGGAGVGDAGRAYVLSTGVPGACASPARAEGTLLFNSPNNVMQYCDGLSWIAIGNEPPDPCAGSPAAGTVCRDGSVYAGLAPDGNVEMFTTPAKAPGIYNWNNGTANYIDTVMVNCSSGAEASCNTGAANTELLAGLSDSASPYGAAAYCAGLSAHGHTDWYLPARGELSVL